MKPFRVMNPSSHGMEKYSLATEPRDVFFKIFHTGRARQMNSKSILLALDTGVEQQEFNNMQKEAMVGKFLKIKK